MINNIQLRLRLNAGKINKIREFYTIFAWNMPGRDREPGRGQMFESKAEAKSLRLMPKFWPQGLNITDLLRSLRTSHWCHKPAELLLFFWPAVLKIWNLIVILCVIF